jgi:hypothetical protein
MTLELTLPRTSVSCNRRVLVICKRLLGLLEVSY